MRDILSHLILPLPIFLGLMVVALIFYFKRKQKTARFFFILSVSWFLLVSTPLIPNFLVQHLEEQYPVISLAELRDTNQPVHILVLGAGHSNNENLPATTRLSEEALAKITEGIRLHRQIPGSIIITSGFKGRGTDAQATVSAEAAVLLGVDAANIKRQTNPGNTLQEATAYKKVYGDSARLIVVTSAIHMPRAMVLFRKAGLQPIPAPVNFIVGKRVKPDYWFWLPSSKNIEKTEKAIHEYVGLIWYKIGRN